MMRRKLFSKQSHKKHQTAKANPQSPNISMTVKTRTGKNSQTTTMKLTGSTIQLQPKIPRVVNSEKNLMRGKRAAIPKAKTKFVQDKKASEHSNKDKSEKDIKVRQPELSYVVKEREFGRKLQRTSNSSKRGSAKALLRSENADGTFCQAMGKDQCHNNVVVQQMTKSYTREKNIKHQAPIKPKPTKNVQPQKSVRNVNVADTAHLKTSAETLYKGRRLKTEEKKHRSLNQTHKTLTKKQKTSAKVESEGIANSKANMTDQKRRSKNKVTGSDKIHSKANKKGKDNSEIHQEQLNQEVKTVKPKSKHKRSKKRPMMLSSAKATINIHSHQIQECSTTKQIRKTNELKNDNRSTKKTITNINERHPGSVPTVNVKENTLQPKAASSPIAQKAKMETTQHPHLTTAAKKKVFDERKAVSMPVTRVKPPVDIKHVQPHSTPTLKLKTNAFTEKPKTASNPLPSKKWKADNPRQPTKKKSGHENVKPCIRMRMRSAFDAEGNQMQKQSKKAFFQQFTADHRRSKKKVRFNESVLAKKSPVKIQPGGFPQKTFEERVQETVRAILRG